MGLWSVCMGCPGIYVGGGGGVVRELGISGSMVCVYGMSWYIYGGGGCICRHNTTTAVSGGVLL